MDKRKINQDVYEKYVDASVALFMEYYCATLSEDIHQEIDKMKTENIEFPDALDARCRATIKKECATRKRKQCLKSCVKGLRYVASVAIVLLALASVLFVSVEAIRVPIINFYIKQTDRYWEFASNDTSDAAHIAGINAEDPLAGLLPDEYNLVMVDNCLPKGLSAIYANANNHEVFFSVTSAISTTRLDSEDATITKECQIMSHKGAILIKGNRITVTWRNEELSKIFSLTAEHFAEQDVVNIAEQLSQRIA